MVGGGIAAALLACQAASMEDNEQEPAMHREPIMRPNFGCSTAMPYSCETAACGCMDTKEDLYY